jgi:hypothetical protein
VRLTVDEPAAAVWKDVADDDDISAGERDPERADGGLPVVADAGARRCCCSVSEADVVSDFMGDADDLFPLRVLLGAGGAGRGRDCTRDSSSSLIQKYSTYKEVFWLLHD